MNQIIDANHQAFIDNLSHYLPANQIYTDELNRYAYGTDASFYRYVPQVVVRAHNETEIITLMQLAKQHQVALTFRASGTSLSGQTCSESVLVLMGDGFLSSEVLDNGEKIKLKPMVIGAHANKLLAPLGRKIGPDPASINTARIGGMAANNSSGMCCGTKENSYHTLAAMRVVLTDGTVLDTSDAQSIQQFRQTHAGLLNQLVGLSQRIKAVPELEQRVRHKYRMKNTTGYGVNALLDFIDPLEMLTHLMIGSEGTLGFISEITYRTVHNYSNKASAFIFFDSLDQCCQAVTALRQHATVDAVELLDALGIRCVGQVKTGLPEFFYQNISDDAACLLIEVKAETSSILDSYIEQIDGILAQYHYRSHTGFQTDPALIEMYWDVRKGFLPIIAGRRPKGANTITEDVVFPIERLADGVRRLTGLFKTYGYSEGVIMGHALEGNMHFILTPNLDSPDEIKRYDDFMQELAHVVTVEFEGSLKGEHGTGRNVAPFVRKEWGDAIYAIMCDIKSLFDPDNILNPEVIISTNEKLHIASLKTMASVDDRVDDCMECGFCEPACPSDGLSLTPRQRITVYRFMSELEQDKSNTIRLDKMRKAYQYQGIATCAATGMCGVRCPVSINTGAFIKKIKPYHPHSRLTGLAERNVALIAHAARAGFAITHRLGNQRIAAWSLAAHKVFPQLPVLPAMMPKPAAAIDIKGIRPAGTTVVYFVSCVNRTLSELNPQHSSVAQHTLSLFAKAGFSAIFPAEMPRLCCGQPFESAKALIDADRASASLNRRLLEASNQGEYPIYLDNAPCALRVLEAQKQGLIDTRLKIYDAATFLLRYVLPKLNIVKKIPQLALHIPCSSSKIGSGAMLSQLAHACTEQLITPDIACCGFAGNKGFVLPELNSNGLRHLKSLLPASCQDGVSMSKTCQIGLTNHAGINYQSIEALLDQCSQKSSNSAKSLINS